VLGGLYLWLLRRRQTACRGCPHDRGSHAPYIPGGGKPGYCAVRSCGCWQYKPERAWTLALAFLRERPPPVTPDVLHQRPVRYPVPGPSEDKDDRTQFGLRVAPYVLRGFTAGQARPRVPRQRDRRGVQR
jgi:hypothetical protein